MILIYIPEPSPPLRGDPPADRMAMHYLLYKRFWLRFSLAGLAPGGQPRIEKAEIELFTFQRRLVRRPLDPARVQIVERPAFVQWYDRHWKEHHTTPPGADK